MSNYVHVCLFEFHNGKIREFVTENDDGSYTVFIEANMSRAEQQESYLHALRHIVGQHFELDDSELAEVLAHEGNKEYWY